MHTALEVVDIRVTQIKQKFRNSDLEAFEFLDILADNDLIEISRGAAADRPMVFQVAL